MNVTEALNRIHAPKGVTTVIEALRSGDARSVQPQSGDGLDVEQAKAKLAAVREAQRTCGSDWAYWGYEGDIAYWTAVVSILEAVALIGPDNLPDVPAPPTQGVVMDLCGKVVRYGAEVLLLAKERAAERPAPEPVKPAAAKRELWRHVKTGGVYEFVCLARRESDGVLLVVYRGVAAGDTWARPSLEFMDGRFVRVEGEG